MNTCITCGKQFESKLEQPTDTECCSIECFLKARIEKKPERDWNKDWWDATSYDVLNPASFNFEKYLQQRKALQYWLQWVRELEEENRCLKAMLDCYVAVLEAVGITANDANIVGKHLKEMEGSKEC